METFTTEQHTALATLQSLAHAFNDAADARERADNGKDGACDMAVSAAIECGAWDVFEPVMAELERTIRENDNGAAELWRAKPGKTEGRFIVPNSVSHIKSRIKKAFELGVSLIDDDGEPRSFNAIKTDVKNTQQVTRDAERAEAQAEAIAEAGDIRDYGAELVARAFTLVRELPEAELAQFITALESTVARHEPVAAEAEAEADTSAEALAA